MQGIFQVSLPSFVMSWFSFLYEVFTR